MLVLPPYKKPAKYYQIDAPKPLSFSSSLYLIFYSRGLNHTYQNMAGKKWISNIAFPPVVSYSWSCGFDDRFIHVRSIHSFTRNLIEPQLLPEREYLEHLFFSFHSTISLIILFFQPDESYHFHDEFRPTKCQTRTTYSSKCRILDDHQGAQS